MREKLILIGNGMAGMRTLEELLKLEPEMYDITVFGAEPYPNYNRILLSPVLAGEKTIDDIILNSREWYEENNIELHTDSTISEIDRANRTVKTEAGEEFKYDRLLIATGSNPFIIPVPGNELVRGRGRRDVQRWSECQGARRPARGGLSTTPA